MKENSFESANKNMENLEEKRKSVKKKFREHYSHPLELENNKAFAELVKMRGIINK